ncbi:MAG: hypothetical protein D3920_13640 [Candidatus Electrothrix sp. AW2]|nr:hypothetical protein [Candidatus Electrothrix gigas]
METVIIAAPSGVNVEDLIEKIPKKFLIQKQTDYRYLISYKSDHCWIEHDDSLKFDYEDEELAIVTKNIHSPIFFCCEFSEMNFGKEVLSCIADNEKYLIDNDHNHIELGNRFVKRIKEEPNWDWRLSK